MWQHFAVEAAPRQLSAEEARERQKAARLLVALDRNEDLAVWSETAALACLRASYTERYRAAIGVPPGDRHRLRAALHRIRDGGGARVDETIDRINSHTNGSGSAASS